MIFIYLIPKNTNSCLIKLLNNSDKVSHDWLAD